MRGVSPYPRVHALHKSALVWRRGCLPKSTLGRRGFSSLTLARSFFSWSTSLRCSSFDRRSRCALSSNCSRSDAACLKDNKKNSKNKEISVGRHRGRGGNAKEVRARFAISSPLFPSLPGAVLGRMQFTLHATHRTPHGASRLVQAMSAWLVKTRSAPSRHSRDARVYGHTTTAMHKLSPPPPAPGHLPLHIRVRKCWY